METRDDSLLTPVHLRTRGNDRWPEDPVFYMLASSGLYLCRNHPFFQSCVPARHWPMDLDSQESFFRPSYPHIARRSFESIVGFFSVVGERHGSEAIVLLAWDRGGRRIRVVVPRQLATVRQTYWGDVYPIGVEYAEPSLPPHWTIIGDAHSHVDESAYSSATDRQDEAYRAGLHIVVGRLDLEPPEILVEAVADGARFHLRWPEVIEGYARREPRFPKSWLARVEVEVRRSYHYGLSADSSSDGAKGSAAAHPAPPHHRCDGETNGMTHHTNRDQEPGHDDRDRGADGRAG
jgi:hypothetical protein